jgi:hypothetical protein
MPVLLDGQALPGLDHRVTIAEQIERKDLSGETSASVGSHGGWKPAVVEVHCLVDMERPGDLADLRRARCWRRSSSSRWGSAAPKWPAEWVCPRAGL